MLLKAVPEKVSLPAACLAADVMLLVLPMAGIEPLAASTEPLIAVDPLLLGDVKIGTMMELGDAANCCSTDLPGLGDAANCWLTDVTGLGDAADCCLTDVTGLGDNATGCLTGVTALGDAANCCSTDCTGRGDAATGRLDAAGLTVVGFGLGLGAAAERTMLLAGSSVPPNASQLHHHLSFLMHMVLLMQQNPSHGASLHWHFLQPDPNPPQASHCLTLYKQGGPL